MLEHSRSFETVDDPRQIDVDMWEWQQGTPENILRTCGLNTCVGVAIWNPVTRMGHLGHFVELPEEQTEVNNMLTSATQDVTNPDNLSVWVRGGACLDMDDAARSSTQRKLILNYLGAAGLRQPNTQWAAHGDIAFDMRLDCATGVCDIEAIDFSA